MSCSFRSSCLVYCMTGTGPSLFHDVDQHISFMLLFLFSTCLKTGFGQYPVIKP